MSIAPGLSLEAGQIDHLLARTGPATFNNNNKIILKIFWTPTNSINIKSNSFW
jgi:hypothetical protein